jgi:hypothetical protein
MWDEMRNYTKSTPVVIFVAKFSTKKLGNFGNLGVFSLCGANLINFAEFLG